ncbi:MAG: hypothetical protein AB8H47_20310 [Bacteroidia bacterium]
MTELEPVVNSFIVGFNKMCHEGRKDHLLRERMVQYESGPRKVQHKVSYQAKKRSDGWQIRAVTKGFWIFKKKFPLMEIKVQPGTISFKGLFTQDLKPVDPNPDALYAELQRYIGICQALPQDAFLNS